MHEHQKEAGFEHCIKCGLKIWKSFHEKLREQYENTVTEEMKTLFMQAIAEGKTIGEAKEFAGIPKHEWETLFTWFIIDENIKTYKYLDLWKNKLFI